MNIRFVVGGLGALVVSSLAALAETPYSADEIDITAAVREAGVAETPVLEQGECAANTVDNAFSCPVRTGGVCDWLSWIGADGKTCEKIVEVR